MPCRDARYCREETELEYAANAHETTSARRLFSVLLCEFHSGLLRNTEDYLEREEYLIF